MKYVDLRLYYILYGSFYVISKITRWEIFILRICHIIAVKKKKRVRITVVATILA